MISEIASAFDLTAIIILGIMLVKATPKLGSGFLDYIAACLAMFLLYAILKAPFLLLFSGFHFPLTTTSSYHLISGCISFAICLSLLLRAIKVNKK